MPRRHSEGHKISVGGWLRAAVLGANDGVVSIASLVIGVAAADASEELGLRLDGLARPMQAATVSAITFAVGAALPLLAIALAPIAIRIWITGGATLLALAGLGTWSARLGGAPVAPAVLRVICGGALAMGLTAGIGYLFGTAVG